MKHARILLLPFIALILSACCGSEPFKHVVFANSPAMFNAIVPVNGDGTSGYITEDVSYYIVFDDEKRYAALTINNLVLHPGDEPMIATFERLQWTYEPGSHEKRRIISADRLTSSDQVSSRVTLTDVTIIYIESNDMNQKNTAGFYVSYTVDDQYRITSYPYAVCADGTTTVKTAGSSTVSNIDYTPVYIVRFTPLSRTAELSAHNVMLGDIAYDFTVSGLSLQLLPDGYQLSKKSTTRITANGESGSLRLMDISATAKLRDELLLKFTVDADGVIYEAECYLAPNLSTLKP